MWGEHLKPNASHFHDKPLSLFLWVTVKATFSTALGSEAGVWASNEVRDCQRWAVPPSQGGPFHLILVGWHKRGWCWQGAGRAISDGNEMGSSLTSNTGRAIPDGIEVGSSLPSSPGRAIGIWEKNEVGSSLPSSTGRAIPDGNEMGSSLTSSPGRAAGICPGHGGSPIIARPDQFHVAHVWSTYHEPLKLHVLWGMTNKGLQSFEKAEFFDNYPNQISEPFEDGLSALRGSVLWGTGRSCNCLTSF